RTHLPDIVCRKEIAPGYPVAGPSTAEGALRQYLLDGQQRMATLYQALMPAVSGVAEPSESEDEKPRSAYLDLEFGGFVWLDKNPGDFFMPLDIIFDSLKFIRFTRRIPDKFLARLDLVDQVAKAFREYKIAIIPIVGEDLTVATRTFQRVNSEGTKMSKQHMLHALTWSSEFDLNARINQIKQEHLADLGWADIDDDRILDICAVALELHPFDRDVDKLSEKIKQHSAILEEIIPCLQNAARFFDERNFIPSPELIPFKEQLVLITEVFRLNGSPSEPILETLRAWLWLTTYTEFFAGTNAYRKMTHALADIRMMASDGQPRWSYHDRRFLRPNLSPEIDFRTARAKAFAVRLAAHAHEHRIDDDPKTLLRDLGMQAVRRLVAGLEPHHYASPGNYFVVRAQDQGRLYRELRGTPSDSYTVALCQQHIVSSDAQRLLTQRRHEEFVKQRRRDLDLWEQSFMDQHKERFL
ncbi:MAG TPA: hypothetical protein PK156_50920, partial [Polyangium sp.]|nr:hypothetical protein [Polyangium sp.]